ncbi:2'-5' RNA ligase family protein [Pelagerythrobacter aerophilus]|uniref:2'-5' RNA ligase family protein n=1 Tax=Pelagerythrobacter aerophilus TaxID=2306995 RepID=A0A418NKF6_9SPHN|nr:2'-5' RNA ligase family protein [Pelagerythrobacter aerophilus]RIV79808.1 2'-5' RNA ligase family protein [Pelagerythrobacter aerophilus]
MTEAAPAPLIVTAELPPDIHRWATRLRAAHYPPERNMLEAHVTLFHALPPGSEDEVRDRLARLAAEYAPVAVRLEGVMSLGTGTALHLTSPDMLALRSDLAAQFHGLLTSQDAHEPRLHITIQNKASPQAARDLQRTLSAEVEPRTFTFSGLALHRYRGGPWEFVKRWAFRGKKRG